MAPELIAQVCYEVERAANVGAEPAWKALSPAKQHALIAKVREHLADPERGPKAVDDKRATSATAEAVAFRKLVLALADGV